MTDLKKLAEVKRWNAGDLYINDEVVKIEDHKAAITTLLQEVETLRRDIETGFMEGAYARLKNLQEAEREVETLRERLEWLWNNCHIVYWPKENSVPGAPSISLAYPIEHSLAARKDSRALIEAAALQHTGEDTKP